LLWDDHGAGYAATRYLLSLGHTRIGTISGPIHNVPQRRSATERHRGWQQALEEQKVTVLPEWIVDGSYTYEGGYQAVNTLLARVEQGLECPTALYVANEPMAVGVLKALHDAGLRIPADISVITTGDPPFAPYTIPALTTLALPVYEAGQVAARILLEWLTVGKPAGAQQITLNCNLKIRESCSPYPLQYPQGGSNKEGFAASPRPDCEQDAVFQGKSNRSSDLAPGNPDTQT
jgi:LacI family transcriptional regulator